MSSIYANPAGQPADTYTRALLDLVGDRNPLDLLPLGPASFENAIAGLSDAQLRTPEGEGKWSIAEVVQHVADAELVGSFRYRMIVAHETPPIASYDQDLWSRNLHYANADVAEALEQFRMLRRINVRLVASLTDEERRRGGMHAERGFEDVNQLMTLLAAHDIVHTRQIARIRAAIGA
jgi:uncharacterized damage-inducible protein DinB